MINGHMNGRNVSAALIALLTYSVSDIHFMLMPDGSLFLDGKQLTQKQLFALSVCLHMPGFRATINWIERVRQAVIVQKLVEGNERPR